MPELLTLLIRQSMKFGGMAHCIRRHKRDAQWHALKQERLFAMSHLANLFPFDRVCDLLSSEAASAEAPRSVPAEDPTRLGMGPRLFPRLHSDGHVQIVSCVGWRGLFALEATCRRGRAERALRRLVLRDGLRRRLGPQLGNYVAKHR